MTVGDDVFEGGYTWASRWEDEGLTNPEELLGAAHAGCYSMALSNTLAKNGFTPQRVHTLAHVHLEGSDITRIELETYADVPDIEREEFMEYAADAKENCPVSKALAGVEIGLDATLR